MSKLIEKLLINPLSRIYNFLTFKPGDFPKKVQIEVTNACNSRCVMCPLKDMKRKVGYMDFELYKKIIDETSRYKLRRLILHIMGEPLLHPKIFEMVAYAKKKNPKQEIEFSTNASLLNKEAGQKLIKSGLDIINLCIDAVSKEVYEKIRSGLNYEKTMDNIYNFLELVGKSFKKKPLAKIQLIKLPENKPEWDGFVNKWQKYAEGKSYVELNIKEMDDWGGYLEKEKKTKDKFYLRVCCDAPFGSLDVFWNGDVSFCCIDYDAKLKVGNVKNQSLKEIWASPVMQRFRKRFIRNDYKGIPLCSICEKAPTYRKFSELNLNPKSIVKKLWR